MAILNTNTVHDLNGLDTYTVQLSYKNWPVKYTSVVCEFLASKLASMPWLLPSIIVKYMDIISRVLAQHTMGDLIVTDRPCLLGHRVKKGEDSTYMQICS